MLNANTRVGIKQVLFEATVFWGIPAGIAAAAWTPLVLNLCTGPDLQQYLPSCSPQVGLGTGAIFFVSMTTLRTLLAAAGHCNDTAKNYFRQLNTKTLVSDLKFALVCVVGDMFFVKTSSSSDLNHLPYSNATAFELGPVLMQSGLSALSMVEGTVTGFGGCALLLGGVYLGEYLYDRCTRKPEIENVDAGGPIVEEVSDDEDEHPARLVCSPAVWDMTEYVNDEAQDEERMYASQQRQSFLSRSISRCANSQCAIL